MIRYITVPLRCSAVGTQLLLQNAVAMTLHCCAPSLPALANCTSLVNAYVSRVGKYKVLSLLHALCLCKFCMMVSFSLDKCAVLLPLQAVGV